jgi:hypothetical protein
MDISIIHILFICTCGQVFDLFYMENQGKIHFEDFIESLSDSVYHPAALVNDKTNGKLKIAN